MKKSYKLLCLTMVVALLFGVFAACQPAAAPAAPAAAPEAKQEAAPEEKPAEAEAPAEAEKPAEPMKDPIVLKLAHHMAIDSAADKAIRFYADLVKERTGGQIQIDVYPASQLGGERDYLEGLELGTVDMSLNTTALIMNLTPEFGLLDLPFLFDSYEHAQAAMYGAPMEYLSQKLMDEHGIRVLGGFCSGFRIMMTTDQKLEKLEDFKGLKMRAPETPIYIDMFKALGANPTPIPFSEVYTAMQTGVVEGVEVAAEYMYNMKFYEVGKYIVQTNHIFSGICPLINEAKFQSLPADCQQAIMECMTEACDYQWELFLAGDDAALQAVIEGGCELTQIDREPLKEACLPMRQQYSDQYNAADFFKLVDECKP